METLKCLVTPLVLTLTLLFSGDRINAQGDTILFEGNMYARLHEPDGAGNAGKTDHFTQPDIPLKFRLKEYQVNIRAVRDFKKRNPEVSDAIWTGSDKGFNARFLEDEAYTTITYSQAGRWKQSMKRYSEPRLPKEIRSRVKSIYYDYAILMVSEMQWDLTQEPVYYVHMQSGYNYKIVAVASEITEVQSFQLQKR
jgi:hypothetical protein